MIRSLTQEEYMVVRGFMMALIKLDDSETVFEMEEDLRWQLLGYFEKDIRW